MASTSPCAWPSPWSGTTGERPARLTCARLWQQARTYAAGLRRLGKHEYPRHVRIVGELPLGPSPEVLGREVRRALVSGA
jgi:hypothetical protein